MVPSFVGIEKGIHHLSLVYGWLLGGRHVGFIAQHPSLPVNPTPNLTPPNLAILGQHYTPATCIKNSFL